MITIRTLVQNMKKGQSSIAVKYILTNLENNYLKIQSKIKVLGCRVIDDGTMIQLKIPSSDKPVSYDVVIWVDTTTKVTLDSNLKCYSNSPFFAFNFAYIFNKEHSLLFPEKYPIEFTTMPPKMRNPFGTVGFDKHVFAALKTVGSKNMSTLCNSFIGVSTQQITSFSEKQEELTRMNRNEATTE